MHRAAASAGPRGIVGVKALESRRQIPVDVAHLNLDAGEKRMA